MKSSIVMRMNPKNKITFVEDGHRYFNEHGVGVPSVSSILQHFGISDYSMVDPAVLEAAQKFGTVVHQTCHLYDIEDLAEWDPEVQPYLGGWESFKKDHLIFNPELIEKPLYSTIWGFAGTPDRLFGSMLPDIKTGDEFSSHRIQTAMYQILIEENFDVKVKERLAVYLKPNRYSVISHKDRTDLSIAKSLITLYNWKKKEGLL